MNLSQEQAVRLGFWAALLLSIFAWAPATYPGYWQAHQGFVPIFNADQSSPIAMIATLPDLWRGMGNGAFLPAQPFIVLGLTPTVAVRIVFGLAFVLGGMGMYIWLRTRLGDRPAGLAALVFMFWPPLLATVYVRGSLADALLMGIVPLALAGLATYVETRAPSAAGVAVLSLLWIWRTQAGLAVVITLLLLAYVIFVERSRLAALVVGVSSAAGLVSLVPLWDITSPPTVDFAQAYVSIYDLLAGSWPNVALVGSHAPHTPGAIPVTLGAAALILGLTTLWFWRSSRLGWRTNILARMLAFAYVTIVLGFLLALPQSAWFWQLTGAQRLVSYPWQMLLLSGPFVGLVAGSLPALQPVLVQTRFWSVLAVIVILSSYPYLQPDFTRIPAPDRPVAVIGPANEIVILDADLDENRAAGEAVLDVTWQVLRTPDFDYNVFFQAQMPENGDFRSVAQLDTQPLDGERPATTWQPGEIFTATYRLDLSSWLATQNAAQAPEPESEQASGSSADDPTPDDSATDTTSSATPPSQLPPLRFDFGYYDWRDGSRLPVDRGIDNKLMFYGP